MPARTRRTGLLVAGTAGLLAGWSVLSALVTGTHDFSMALLACGVGAAVLGGRAVGRRSPWLVPAVVAAGPLLALVLNEPELLGEGPLGYANASGALAFLGVAGALTVAAGAEARGVRIVAYLAAATWTLVAWRVGADAALVLSLLLVLVAVGARSPGARRAILPLGAGAVLGGLLVAGTLGGSGYDPTEGGSRADAWFERHLGELRPHLWGDALRLARAHPVLGVGPGGFPAASPTARPRGARLQAHNEYLQAAAETGVPGGLLLLAIVGGGFLLLRPVAGRRAALPTVVALAGVSLNADIDFVWRSPEVPLLLALLVGSTSAGARALVPAEGSGAASGEAGPAGIGRGRIVEAATAALWLVLLVPVAGVNPPPTATNGAEREGGGVRFDSPGMLRSARPPAALYEGIVRNRELSLVVWVEAGLPEQGSPARILSSSGGTRVRNFTLGQEGDALSFRLRSSETDSNGRPPLEIEGVFAEAGLRHVVVSTNVDEIRVWVDGTIRRSVRGPGGDLEGWDREHPLLVGNEVGGARPWLGEVRFAEVHDRALTQDEVAAMYRAGPLAREAGGGIVPTLDRPARISAPSRPLLQRLADPDGERAARLGAHALLFGLWASLAGRGLPGAAGRRRSTIAMGGILLALAALPVRNVLGQAPAHWDLVGALTGIAAGLLVLSVGRDRPG